ncbi:amino acid permease [Enterococcus sp. BWT-B8]|uniref:APC family permease n=1 Tax=unclassified Enterococcus TaxID=2608891 RepID=UPI001E4AE044|nr:MULTISPECIES: amino acid permease [unclassified Enterococcus]MCB5951896.1 amino acid permease [Enterococcus sp. BWT-B8]MCB5954092.1 amino acid permease [Enterococcus sp. CWB-B31]
MKNELKREISFFGALSTVMGTVIGAGVFFKAAAVVEKTQATGLTLVVWLLAGFLTICGGLTVAELATAIPETGGPIRYIERIYGKLPSFLLGWAQSIIYFPANIAALSIIFATQLVNLFHLSAGNLLPLAFCTAVSVTGINLLGTKTAAGVQSLTLSVKLIPIALIIIVGLFTPGKVDVSLFTMSSGQGNSWAVGVSGALLATLFAYDGWLGVGNIAGEMKHPEKDLPKAIILGLSFVTIVYVLINLVFLKTLPISSIAGNLNSASETAMVIFGEFGGKLVTIGILISVYGALNGYTMTGLRVPYAMALENQLPFSTAFGKLSKRTNAPFIAAYVQLGIACVMITLGNFDLLTDMLVFVMWFFSLLLFWGVLRLRKTEPELKRPYKVPLYPIVPLIAMVGGGFILVMTAVTTPMLALVGIGMTCVGIPVFYYQQKKG